MLNYNLNINSPLQQAKKNEDVRPEITWDFHSFASASDSSDLPELGFATMSINAIGSNCIQVSNDNGGFFQTDAQSQVTASITGSNWPTTGSVTMSLNTFGISYDPVTPNQFFSEAISASAAEIIANPNISGSKLDNKFLATEFIRYYTSGSIIHRKGNIFNPKINYNVIVSSPSASYVSASFIIKKDTPNVPVVTQIYASASNSGSVDYAYSFNMSASLSGAADFWASSYQFKEYTMSLSIPKISKYQESFFTNGDLTASFIATDNIPFNITASIELVPWTPFPVEIIAIAGGGAGGGSNNKLNAGGGGGAGAVVSASWNIPVLTTFNINIGAGGTGITGSVSGLSGGDTTVYWNNTSSSILISKGGSGGAASGQTSADGGSTGGGVGGPGGVTGDVLTNTFPPNSTQTLSPTGNKGSTGHIHRSDTPVPFSELGGGGGGATSAGFRDSSYNGGAGGFGINLSTFGLGTLAAGGAGGAYLVDGTNPGRQSDGVNASPNTGNGGGGAIGGDTPTATQNVKGGNGGSGIVVIRYPGEQIAIGGTVSQSLNYTTHTFTASGEFSPTAYFQCCKPIETTIEYVVVAGGGSGAGSVPIGGITNAGGGAGGTVRTGSLSLPESGNIFSVVVGLGAQTGSGATSNGNAGTNSSIFGTISNGGGAGGSSRLGSGAGGSNAIFTTNGSGGAGGGANGDNLNGGAGYQWLDGIIYAGGGLGQFTPGGGNITTGIAGSGAGNPGGGGNGLINGDNSRNQTAGKNGIVILRYNGNSQKATGGTITYDNGYVYHTFTSSADFNVLY